MEINKMAIEEVLKALANGKVVKAECDSLWFYLKIQDGTILYSSLEDGNGSTGFSFGTEYSYSIHEPPKPKKRYWQWKIQDSDGVWYRNDFYMDEDGYATGGRCTISSFTTAVERIKIEDDYIEV